MSSGVYCITNAVNGKVYVGSAVDLRRRWKDHRSKLISGSHRNRYLAASWQKYGADAFVFEVLEHVEPEALVVREQFWIDALHACRRGSGYNLSPTAGSVLGFRFTDEQRANVSAGLKGKRKSAEHRANLSTAHKRRVDDKFVALMAENGRKGRGRLKSPDHRRKIGESQQGSRNHYAKLNEAKAALIRERLKAGERGRALAAEFGISESIVSEIKHGRRWLPVPT